MIAASYVSCVCHGAYPANHHAAKQTHAEELQPQSGRYFFISSLEDQGDRALYGKDTKETIGERPWEELSGPCCQIACMWKQQVERCVSHLSRSRLMSFTAVLLSSLLERHLSLVCHVPDFLLQL